MSSDPRKMIPVLILNMGYSGLGIARNLRGKGMNVYGLTAHPEIPAARTRMCDKIFQIPDSREEPEALVERLLEIITEVGEQGIIFPTRDDDVLFLDRYRAQLEPRLIIPQPPGEILRRVMDKYELFQIAQRVGISVPLTHLIRQGDEARAIVNSVSYPVIVKPRYSVYWRGKKQWRQIGEQKAMLVRDPNELREAIFRVRAVGADAVIQEYVAGNDQTLVSCNCYFNRAGELAGYFCSRKVMQSPEGTGTGCLVCAARIDEIVEPTIKLLRACEYRGMAEVEYKKDPVSDRYWLIEINARHWDQHELGTRLGVNLTWAMYSDYAGLPIPLEQTEPAYTGPVFWIAERELFLELGRRIYHQISGKKNGARRGGPEASAGRCSPGNGGYRLKVLTGKKIWAGMRWNDPRASVATLMKIAEEWGGRLRKRMVR